MKLYDCQVRLSGNINHSVPKFKCSDLEILMLRHLHGNDSVVHIRSAGSDDKRSEMDEYKHLAGIYGQEKVEALFMVKLDLNSVIVEDDPDESAEISLPASVAAAMKGQQQPAKAS
jgi:hypothetical protein